MERITIIGIGPVGMSIGLGLKAAGLTDTEILATSGDRKTLNYGKEIGAFDEISSSLRSAPARRTDGHTRLDPRRGEGAHGGHRPDPGGGLPGSPIPASPRSR